MQRPVLPDLASLAWDCFWDLNRERPLGFGAMGHIAWSAIDRWAVRYAIGGEQFTRLKRIVEALDGAWLARVAAANPRPPTPGGG